MCKGPGSGVLSSEQPERRPVGCCGVNRGGEWKEMKWWKEAGSRFCRAWWALVRTSEVPLSAVEP